MRWMIDNRELVGQLLANHLLLALPAIALSLLIALPLGWLAWRRPRIGGPLQTIAALSYAIPALPLLVVIPIMVGVPLRSNANMIIALTVYGVALLVRTVSDALAAVDHPVRDAAVATGHSPAAMFWLVDLPLAGPVILSGLRVATVSTVGLVTIGALIGVPGLGRLITDGFQRGLVDEVLGGMLLTVAVALLLDLGLIAVGRLLMPWTSRRRRGTGQSAQPATALREVVTR